MRSHELSPEFHSANRAKLAEAIGPEAIAIIDTADVLTRAGDFEYPFRPDSNFYYLTGIDEPGAALVLMPGHPNPKLREVLFLPQTDEFRALWEGERTSHDTGRARSGITAVMDVAELELVMERPLAKFFTVYTNAETSLQPGPLGPAARRLQDWRARLPQHQFRSALPQLGRQRTVKAPGEVAAIQAAVDLTAAGLAKAWAALRPGVPEYAVAAELTAEFARAGADVAFSPIVAAGAHSTVIHYHTGPTPVGKSDLVLFDVGAESGYYAADISRTVPASGHFTERQRAVYEVVYRAQAAGLKLHKPGATILEIDEAMRVVLTQGLVELGELTAVQAAGPQAEEHLRRYYAHISHHLGLDVHDTGDARMPFEPGMVVTCEPGLYLPKEGIGVRIEDVILITKTDHEVLSKAIPSDPDAVEAMLRARSK